MTFEKQKQTGVRIPYKIVNMPLTDVNTAPGQTPQSYSNQSFANIVNPQKQFQIIVNPLTWNQ